MGCLWLFTAVQKVLQKLGIFLSKMSTLPKKCLNRLRHNHSKGMLHNIGHLGTHKFNGYTPHLDNFEGSFADWK